MTRLGAQQDEQKEAGHRHEYPALVNGDFEDLIPVQAQRVQGFVGKRDPDGASDHVGQAGAQRDVEEFTAHWNSKPPRLLQSGGTGRFKHVRCFHA